MYLSSYCLFISSEEVGARKEGEATSQRNPAMPRPEANWSSELGSVIRPCRPGSLCLYSCSQCAHSSHQALPLLDAPQPKPDLPRVQESSPQLPKDSETIIPLKTLCFCGFSQTVTIMTASGEPLSPEVLSVNAGNNHHLLHGILF